MTKEQSSQIDTSLCLSSMTVSDYGADQRLSMTVVRSKTAKFVNDRAESRILDTGGRIFSLSLTWRWPLLLRHHLWKPCSLWFENEKLQHWHWHWPFIFTSNYWDWHWHHFIELTWLAQTRCSQVSVSPLKRWRRCHRTRTSSGTCSIGHTPGYDPDAKR